MKKLPVILFFFIILQVQFVAATSAYINTEDHPGSPVTMAQYVVDHSPSHKQLSAFKQEEKKLLQLEKAIKKIQLHRSATSQSSGIFSDSVNKWFWFWIIAWGLGLLLTLISGASLTAGFVGILWFSLFIVGSIALVIWLIKKFS